MKKYLAIEVSKDKKRLRIVEQTHREDKFGKDGKYFFEHNSFVIWSVTAPDVFYVYGLFVRGCDKSSDSDIVRVPSASWLKDCIAAVKAYNEYFNGKPTEKGWVRYE